MIIRVKVSRAENVDYFKVTNGDIVAIDIEDYLCGVVGSEIGNASLEACKAQAIASRTYAMPYIGDSKYITDQSSKNQAFRASRMDQDKYPNAIQGVSGTAGMVLTYDGAILKTCSFSSSNGGKTVSSQERWGGYRPYLIAQDDPWDASACAERASAGKSVTNKGEQSEPSARNGGAMKREACDQAERGAQAVRGHGVGMSQYGASWAAKNGINAEKILAFYYPGTVLAGNYGKEASAMATEKTIVNAADVITLFKRALSEKWGYIWGKSGQTWTKAQQDAATREQTIKWGSKWVGRKVADCSGLFAWAYKQLGGYMYHGSNTMWKKYCASNGKLVNGKREDGQELRPGTAVFLNDNGNRHHVGLYVGDGLVIEARGTYYGVVTSKIERWDEWGELINTAFDGDLPAYKLGARTLRKGNEGDDVAELQRALIAIGYNLGTFGAEKNGVDGSYGSKTEAAVKAFQTAHGLEADGVCGKLTFDVLAGTLAQPEQPSKGEQSEPRAGNGEAVEREARDQAERGAQAENAQYRLTILGDVDYLRTVQSEYGGTLEVVELFTSG